MRSPPPDAAPPPPAEPAWRAFARAPLAPVAAAAAMGLAADRYLVIPLDLALAAAAVALAAAAVVKSKPLVWLVVAALAAAHHHAHRHAFPADDIGSAATETPAIVKVRGTLDEPPTPRPPHSSDAFGPVRPIERAVGVLAVTHIHAADGWRPASGRVRISVERPAGESDPAFFAAVQLGDAVEVVGLLARPRSPANPGEFDYRGFLLDERIRAELRVTKGAAGVTRLSPAEGSFGRGVVAVRGAMTRYLNDALPPREAGLARALLLGDTAALARDEWDAFARTGVVHVLAISGQHLVILAGFAWLAMRIFDVPRRRGAIAVAVLVVAYAILTGARPSAVRAAVAVVVACGGLILRRPTRPADGFCLAFLLVAALDPADPFSAGCQLSFVAVFVLIWGCAEWFAPQPLAPLDQLTDDVRPAWVRVVRAAFRAVGVAYLVSLVITAALAPLLMAKQNIAPPVGVLIGPPLVLLTTLALVAGFAAIGIGLISTTAADPFAAVAGWLLSACDRIVAAGDGLPGGSLYVPDPPAGWAVGFYLLLAAVVLVVRRWRLRCALALAAWTAFGLAGAPADRGDELRVTFLAVGHGGCTVLECPDGRVLVYDAGAMTGGDAVRRVVAPYLWHRGVRRIDELFLSHADADHYNGVPALVRRFPVGRVTLSPSFALKPAADVAEVLLVLDRAGVPRRVAVAGDRSAAGAVEITVLHPPAGGPPGTENERSLVLKVVHAGHVVLLTGDLEKLGTAELLQTPPVPADVLMAPHHGSRAALPAALAAWATPRLVVACRGARDGSPVVPAGVPAWDTWSAGAVTIRSNPTGLTAEAHLTGERLVVRRGTK